MKCKIKHHNDSHFPGTVSQSVHLAQYSIHLACRKKPQRRNVVLHFSSHEPSRNRSIQTLFPTMFNSGPPVKASAVLTHPSNNQGCHAGPRL